LDNGVVAEVSILNGVVEERGVCGEPGYRKFFDITPISALGQKATGNVVKLEALSEIVQTLGCFHRSSYCLVEDLGLPSSTD